MSTVTPLIPLVERPLHERVAANVRAEMARLGISQAAISATLGITQQSVSSKRNGKTPFTINELDMIAPLFGLTAADLLVGTRAPFPSTGAVQPTDYSGSNVISITSRERRVTSVVEADADAPLAPVMSLADAR